MAQSAVYIKNRNFLRQLRSQQFNDYIFTEEVNGISFYRHVRTNEEFVLKQIRDDYRYFQLEYFVDILNNNEGYRNITKFLAPSAIFYTTTSTYQLVTVTQLRARLVPLKKYFEDLQDVQKLTKRSISIAFYVFEHLLKLLCLLHSLGLSLSGNFNQLYFVNEILKLDLVNLAVKVPETHAEGIKKDLLELKVNLDTIFQVQFRRHLSAEHLVEMLKQVMRVIDEFIRDAQDSQDSREDFCGLRRGLDITQASLLISQLPFFTQVRYMTFPPPGDASAILFRAELEASQKTAQKIAGRQEIRRLRAIRQHPDDYPDMTPQTGFYMRPLSAGALRKIRPAKQIENSILDLQNQQIPQSQHPHTLQGPKAAKKPIDEPVTLQRLKRTNSITDEGQLNIKQYCDTLGRQYERGFQGRRCHSGAVYNKKESIEPFEIPKMQLERKQHPRQPSATLLHNDEQKIIQRPSNDAELIDVFDDNMERVKQRLSSLSLHSIALSTSQIRTQRITHSITHYSHHCIEMEKRSGIKEVGNGVQQVSEFRLKTPEPKAKEFQGKQMHTKVSPVMEKRVDGGEKRLHMNSREESGRGSIRGASQDSLLVSDNQRSVSQAKSPVSCGLAIGKSASLPTRQRQQKRHRILQEIPLRALEAEARAQVQINIQALNSRRLEWVK